MSNESLTSWDANKAKIFQKSFAEWCQGTIPEIMNAALAVHQEDLADTHSGSTKPTLIDVGCGDGRLAKRAVEAGFAVTACDREPGMLALAEETCAGLGVVVQSAALPDLAELENNTYDVVVSNFVVHHIRDPFAAVRGLARIAKPGGRVITTVWPDGYNPSRKAFVDAIEHVPGVVAPGHKEAASSVKSPVTRSFEGLAELSVQAGLNIVAAKNMAWDWHISRAAIWAGTEAGVGATGEMFVAQEVAVQDAMRKYVDAVLDAFVVGGDPDALILPCVAAICVADKG